MRPVTDHSEQKDRVPKEHQKVFSSFLVGLVLLGGIGILDWCITSDISVSTVYMVPVGFVAWYVNRQAALLMAVMAAAVWFVAEYFGRAPLVALNATLWQCLSRLGFYAVMAILVGRVRTLTLNLESSVRQRTHALELEITRRQELEREAAEISDREQERVAQELHDQLAAYLGGLAFRAATLADDLAARRAPETSAARELVGAIGCATNQVREFAHLLAPTQETESLAAALAQIGEETETFFRITCMVDVPKTLPPFSPDQSAQLCRIAHEAVRNAIQHGKAQVVRISVQIEKPGLKLSIQSDGRSWEPELSHPAGLGIRIMRCRTSTLGGTLSIQALDGGGTVVSCTVPCYSAKPTDANQSCARQDRRTTQNLEFEV
jgi:signal transduction histidine kinase